MTAYSAASLAYLAQVCARLDDKKRADVLYAMLLPYDGRNLLIGTTVGCFGAAASLLGLLATTQRKWQDAQRHFESALALNFRQGASPALAHTRLRYASMRLARNADGDRDGASALLEDARAAAVCMGMRTLTERIDELRRSIGPASSPVCPAGLSARSSGASTGGERARKSRNRQAAVPEPEHGRQPHSGDPGQDRIRQSHGGCSVRDPQRFSGIITIGRPERRAYEHGPNMPRIG